jgi:hypothetical protein
MFPSQGDRQLISREVVDKAAERVLDVFDTYAPLTMAIDVARFGEDASVISFKQGRDARSIPWQRYKKISTTELVEHAVVAINKYNPDAIFVDGNGVGGGVVDQLRALGYVVIEVQFGESANEPLRFSNKRTECWCLMAEWLEVGAIPDAKTLKTDLCSPEFGYTGKDNQKALEPKDKTKKRGLASPDDGDSLALHFAKVIARKDSRSRTRARQGKVAKGMDYDVI